MVLKHRKTTLTGLTLLLALTCLSFKCGGQGGNADPKRRYAKASDDIAAVINAMIDAKRRLAQQQLITAEEELRLTHLLSATLAADIRFNNRLKSTTTVDASTRNDLLNLLSQVTTAVNDLNNVGVLSIGNANAKLRMAQFIGSINAAIAILSQLNDCHVIPPNCYQCGNGPVDCPPN